MNYPKNRYTGESPWKKKCWLYHQYIELDRSSKEIAEEYGCVRNTIQQWLATYKIKKEKVKRIRAIKHKYQEKDYLFVEHIINKKNMAKIAKECGCSIDTIKKYLERYDIPIFRTTGKGNLENYDVYDLYVNKKMSSNKIAQLAKSSHKAVMDSLANLGVEKRSLSESQFNSLGKEKNHLLSNKKWLYETYIKNRKSAKDIGDLLNHDAGTVRRWLVKHDIPLRNSAESKIGLMVGEKHPNWQGGISKLNVLCREYFNINIAPAIAKRDKYTCQLCGKQHCVLHVHHIYHFSDILKDIICEHKDLKISDNEDKEKLYNIIVNDDMFNDKNNLITYCKDCHFFKIHKYTRRQSATKPQAGEGSTTIENTP